MAICDVCHKNPSTRSAIVSSQYYAHICTICYEAKLAGNTVSSGHAEYERGRDAEEHEADIMQPMGPGGIPSAEFIKLYPDTAKKVFTPDEINRAIRS